MTATQTTMESDPFLQGLVDYTTAIYYDYAVVLSRYDDSWHFAGFDTIKILDSTSWTNFVVLFLLVTILTSLIIYLFPKMKKTFFQCIHTVIYMQIGTFLGKGK